MNRQASLAQLISLSRIHLAALWLIPVFQGVLAFLIIAQYGA